MTAPRFPRQVYEVGTEPDPRFTLANERTFLAWIRTALALIAAGIALEALALPIRPDLRRIAAIILALPVVIGVSTAAALLVLGVLTR